MKNFISTDLQKTIEADEQFIAARLRNLRVRAVIALEEFAEALGIEPSELSAYENGDEDVPASIIALACALSGVPFEYFFENDAAASGEQKVKKATSEEHAVSLS